MKIKRTKGEIVFDAAIYFFVGMISLACLYPMLYVLFASLSEPTRIMYHQGGLLWPLGFSLKGYEAVIGRQDVWTGYANTLFYVTVGTSLNMVMTVMGTYVLSRRDFMFRKPLTMMFVFTMYFTGGTIPNFILVKSLGLLNTRWALILPVAIGTWNMLIMRTAFASVPSALEEAALIDGANDLQILTKVILPVSKATLAVIFLFYAVGHWNSWFNALIYLPNERELFPLQLILREVLISNSDYSSSEISVDYLGESIRYAIIIVSTVPILCIYPFIQKYFVKGVMMGSVKG
ncbi:carbohydrate ABC transporter permease [Ruthenibacterium lactatiformans]|uniref:ABC transporter permease subunit n=1 Tax=Ruthenibacterium lactatiformans TaxID=1550024 RepID=A0A6L6LVD6_9FIRM|nr:carbohydrate ABC transporter permease [Ruthenibacterium lactatiformans]MTQ81991.1 ABC transporter permease subunit [Ruthenibacterium lactatiformans]MTS21832.1 ABC transporter permease subunit [Ruthenibacterium lactatiformans]MTS28803.1 ABC transporter permease subunit [Ruthenibacterium lactatiformans]MTS32464.1 ABC transporter permease subunit [Ruthenibacterium lactatiformans]MTS39287.1 ABC transporter permease subunit [Ruthenibacterium lactatiformans]